MSLRDFAELLFERGVVVIYAPKAPPSGDETIQCCCDKFGAGFARQVEAARRKPGSTWHPDEMFVTLRGEPYLPWQWCCRQYTGYRSGPARSGKTPMQRAARRAVKQVAGRYRCAAPRFRMHCAETDWLAIAITDLVNVADFVVDADIGHTEANRPGSEGNEMSHAAQDLIELQRLAQSDTSALTQHLMREIAMNIIAPGVADERDGCWADSACYCDKSLNTPETPQASGAWCAGGAR